MHTFVIPAYGESPFLELCIGSLMAQTVKSELIMVTSTPSAYLEQLADQYALKYYVHDKNGIASDWNFGLTKVTTALATIAHQDDIYEPRYAELMINAFNKPGAEHTQIAFTDYADIINDKKINYSLNRFVKKTLLLPFIFSNTIYSRLFKKLILMPGDPICCPSVTFNLKAIPGFRFSTEYSCILDWYAWYKLASEKGAFCFINKKLVLHRIHEESETTNQLSKGIRSAEELKMLQLIWGNRLGKLVARIYSSGHKHNKAAIN
jgi:glycosyltransferase involved in cell wall biosynthesis